MDSHLSPEAFAFSLSEDELVQICKNQPRSDERGWQVTGCPYPPESPLIFIKYGYNSISLRDSEARTHQWAYDALERLPQEARRGIRIPKIYRVAQPGPQTIILMEYIVGKTLGQLQEDWQAFLKVEGGYSDQIAAGLRLLLSLPVPKDAAPGPVGGGLIRHPLYKNYRAPIIYDSVDMLEKHLNKVATMLTTEAPTVTLERELHLVFADFYEGNFMFTDAGDLYIIDFEQASFLPLSFMSYALIQHHWAAFTTEKRLGKDLPQNNIAAMRHICGYLVMSRWDICLPL